MPVDWHLESVATGDEKSKGKKKIYIYYLPSDLDTIENEYIFIFEQSVGNPAANQRRQMSMSLRSLPIKPIEFKLVAIGAPISLFLLLDIFRDDISDPASLELSP